MEDTIQTCRTTIKLPNVLADVCFLYRMVERRIVQSILVEMKYTSGLGSLSIIILYYNRRVMQSVLPIVVAVLNWQNKGQIGLTFLQFPYVTV